MSATNEPKYITVALTDSAPVKVRDDQWPVIAHGSYSWHDGRIAEEAARTPMPAP